MICYHIWPAKRDKTELRVEPLKVSPWCRSHQCLWFSSPQLRLGSTSGLLGYFGRQMSQTVSWPTFMTSGYVWLCYTTEWSGLEVGILVSYTNIPASLHVDRCYGLLLGQGMKFGLRLSPIRACIHNLKPTLQPRHTSCITWQNTELAQIKIKPKSFHICNKVPTIAIKPSRAYIYRYDVSNKDTKQMKIKQFERMNIVTYWQTEALVPAILVPAPSHASSNGVWAPNFKGWQAREDDQLVYKKMAGTQQMPQQQLPLQQVSILKHFQS